MRLTRVRAGELIALAGAACVIVALFEPWYESAAGRLDAWDTFGPGVVLLIAAAAAALGLLFSTLAERSVALPVAAAVWSVLFGLVAVISAVVRVLERPDHATSLCAGAWLALAGAVAILAGAWQSLRDERGSMYEPARPGHAPARSGRSRRCPPPVAQSPPAIADSPCGAGRKFVQDCRRGAELCNNGCNPGHRRLGNQADFTDLRGTAQ